MEPIPSPREKICDFEQLLARAEEMYFSQPPASRDSHAPKATLRGADPRCREKLSSKDELFFEVFRKATALFEAKKDGVNLPRETYFRLYSLSRKVSVLGGLQQKISSIFIEKIETEICGRPDFDHSFQLLSLQRFCKELLDVDDISRITHSMKSMIIEREMLRFILVYEALSFYKILIFKKINETNPFFCFNIVEDRLSTCFSFSEESSVEAVEAIGMLEAIQRMQSLEAYTAYLKKIGLQYPLFNPMARQVFDCLILSVMLQDVINLQVAFKKDVEYLPCSFDQEKAKTQYAQAFIDAWKQRKANQLSLRIEDYFKNPEAVSPGEDVGSAGLLFVAESVRTLSHYVRSFEENTRGQMPVYEDGYRLLTDLLHRFCEQKKIPRSDARFIEGQFSPKLFTDTKLPIIRPLEETTQVLNDISRWVHLFVYEERVDFLEELGGIGFEGRRAFGRDVLCSRSGCPAYSDLYAAKDKPAGSEKGAGPERAKRSKPSAPKQKTSKQKIRPPIQESPLKVQEAFPLPEENPAPMADGGEAELSGKGGVDAELSARMIAVHISDEETPKLELGEEVVQVVDLAQNERRRQPRERAAAAALSTPCTLARRPVLHERVESWTAHIHPRAEVLQGRLDPVTCHSFPILVSRLIKANSLPREFVSKATEKMNQLYECIGSVRLPGEGSPILTGIYEDCYDSDTLYHHFFRQMHSKAILQWRVGEGASCTHIEQALHEVVPQRDREEPVACYSPGRYTVEKRTFSVTVIDQVSGIEYTVAFPEPLK